MVYVRALNVSFISTAKIVYAGVLGFYVLWFLNFI